MDTSATQWTPRWSRGPWSLGGAPSLKVWSAYKEKVVCECWPQGPDEGKANGHLIAAAPEMAEALRPFAAFLEALETMTNLPKTGETHIIESHIVGRRALTVEDFKAARAALKKALGDRS